jgi:tetratricopeptide (TPR) repeat protein
VEISLEQDPLSALLRSLFALVLLLAGQYERAWAEAGKALEFDATIWVAPTAMALAYAARGMFAEAREPAEKMIRLAPWNMTLVGTLAGIFSRLGEQDRASELIGRCKDKPAAMWFYHLLCAEFGAALDSYEAALDLHDPNAPLFAASDWLRPLRETPRWPAIARKMNLPAAV